MKRIITLLLIFLTAHSFAQCFTSDYIMENYLTDAKILLLREIQSNPDDPDYNEPFIDESRLDYYLERLSALHANIIEEPMLDSIFGPLNIHVNVEYMPTVYHRGILMAAPYDPSWVDPYLETGLSGIPEFDALIETYSFEEVSSFITGSGSFFLWIETTEDALNIIPIASDFDALEIISSASPDTDINYRFNYTGVPFTLPGGASAEVCDIVFIEDDVRFYIAGGDCPLGCEQFTGWTFNVSETCEVSFLDVPEFDSDRIVVYPNPATDLLKIQGGGTSFTLKLFTMDGRQLEPNMIAENTIDVSGLNAGLYVLKVTDLKGDSVTKTVIIN
ncbi:T9SS type A sorting domain-containing protein [Gilvibacter sp. SZ-19]|uniref:T9SS type A sorting domain-containing protein n=1 Tax=Gilvibacter sp. SZ-19 TaxID=754429 RepID=UPI0012FAF96B|nr:T9SS type A sorting domain-containing protein [Gilvibacter sp. SZ-19]